MNPEVIERPAAAPRARRVAPKKASPRNAASPKAAAPKAKRAARAAKPKATQVKAKRPAAKPAKSKAEIILALIGRKGGATLAALMAATDWQKHSIRGFISLAQSRRGLKVASAKNEKGERVYALGKSAK